MNIHVHYTRTVKRGFRPTFRMNRWLLGVSWAVAALALLSTVVAATAPRTPNQASATEFFAELAVLFAILPVAAIWPRLYAERRTGAGTTADVTVTDRLITRRAGVDIREFGWEMVHRVVETRGFWIFVVNRRTTVTLFKSDLNSEQRAELEAFLARRRMAPSATRTSTLG